MIGLFLLFFPLASGQDCSSYAINSSVVGTAHVYSNEWALFDEETLFQIAINAPTDSTFSPVSQGVQFLSNRNTPECPSQCLTGLATYRDQNQGNFSTILHFPPELSYYLLPSYRQQNSTAELVCARMRGYCGASVAVYRYYRITMNGIYHAYSYNQSEQIDSYYQELMPICYAWSLPNGPPPIQGSSSTPCMTTTPALPSFLLTNLNIYDNNAGGTQRDHYYTTHQGTADLMGYNFVGVLGKVINTSSTPCTCLTRLVQQVDNQTGYFSRLDHKLLQPGAESNRPYESYVMTGEKFYCVKKRGDCGASVPLYKYFQFYDIDSIYTTDSSVYIPLAYQYPMTPLCYIWPADYGAVPAPSTVPSAPSTMSPAPSTMSPAPSTMSPAPSTMSPAPSTMSPAPSTMSPAPSTMSPAPSTLFPPVPTFFPPLPTLAPAPSTTTNVPSTLLTTTRAPSTTTRTTSPLFPTLPTLDPAPSTRSNVPSTLVTTTRAPSTTTREFSPLFPTLPTLGPAPSTRSNVPSTLVTTTRAPSTTTHEFSPLFPTLPTLPPAPSTRSNVPSTLITTTRAPSTVSSLFPAPSTSRSLGSSPAPSTLFPPLPTLFPVPSTSRRTAALPPILGSEDDVNVEKRSSEDDDSLTTSLPLDWTVTLPSVLYRPVQLSITKKYTLPEKPTVEEQTGTVQKIQAKVVDEGFFSGIWGKITGLFRGEEEATTVAPATTVPTVTVTGKRRKTTMTTTTTTIPATTTEGGLSGFINKAGNAINGFFADGTTTTPKPTTTTPFDVKNMKGLVGQFING